jgi:transcriptional regulator with XRE-family HTH domain
MLLFTRGENVELNLVDIGERARLARVSRKLKQEHVSEAIGVAQSSYSRFENGMYDMPVTKIVMLCEMLDVSLYWMLGIK